MGLPFVAAEEKFGTRPAPGSLFLDVLVALLFAGLLAPLLRLDLASSPDLPTGGDLASHVLYAWLFEHVALPAGQLTAWLPEVFGGYPLHAYYFPLPFIVAALLGKLIGFAAGLKWATILPTLLLPGTVFTLSRHVLRMPALTAFCGALGTLSFLGHEQNSIWGGNLLSTFSGEFAYGWGAWLSFITLVAWLRAVRRGHGWPLAAALEALTALAHGYPLLVTGFTSWLLLIDAPDRRSAALSLLKGHLLAFLLLGGWLWPLLEMHDLTIPNDGGSGNYTWTEMLPQTLWPLLGGAALGLLIMLTRRRTASAIAGLILFFLHASGLCVVLWMAADRVGLLDIRFLPLAWLLAAVASGWTIGHAVRLLLPKARPAVLAPVLLLTQLGWLVPQIHQAPAWAQWNFSGTNGKAGWHALSKLFPAMAGDLNSPRLLFEHAPANQDLGSTRSLEALPMYLNGRPVLEGLYMESAILGPAVYRLQSEVSTQPSSPLFRFPSGHLDPALAATHMQMLRANQVLLRSPEAKRALLDSGLFESVADSPPFMLLQLKNFDDALVDGSHRLWRLKPLKGWMEDSHAWFGSRPRMNAEWPVYADKFGADEQAAFRPTTAETRIDNIQAGRDRLSFSTSAPGRPHLVKITYHPRWRLESKGRIYLAAPGFMLVVPEETSVRLVFGTTTVGRLGEWASGFAALLLIALLCRRQAATPAAEARPYVLRWSANIALATALLGCALWLHETSSARLYAEGWTEMNAEHFENAAALFLDASQRRRAPPAREEALFWAAKAFERAGRREQARAVYRELLDTGHGYWIPESLFTYAQLMRDAEQLSQARQAEARLEQEFPDNEWRRKLGDGHKP